MAGKGAEFSLGCHLPNPNCVISTARSQQTTIMTESHLGNAFAVTLQGPDLAAGGDIPKQDLADGFELYVLHHLIRIGWLRRIFLLAFLWHAAQGCQVEIRL